MNLAKTLHYMSKASKYILRLSNQLSKSTLVWQDHSVCSPGVVSHSRLDSGSQAWAGVAYGFQKHPTNSGTFCGERASSEWADQSTQNPLSLRSRAYLWSGLGRQRQLDPRSWLCSQLMNSRYSKRLHIQGEGKRETRD